MYMYVSCGVWPRNVQETLERQLSDNRKNTVRQPQNCPATFKRRPRLQKLGCTSQEHRTKFMMIEKIPIGIRMTKLIKAYFTSLPIFGKKNCSISSGNRAAYGIRNVVDQFLDISTFSAKFARFCRPQDSCTVAAKLPQERLTTTLQLTCVQTCQSSVVSALRKPYDSYTIFVQQPCGSLAMDSNCSKTNVNRTKLKGECARSLRSVRFFLSRSPYIKVSHMTLLRLENATKELGKGQGTG